MAAPGVCSELLLSDDDVEVCCLSSHGWSHPQPLLLGHYDNSVRNKNTILLYRFCFFFILYANDHCQVTSLEPRLPFTCTNTVELLHRLSQTDRPILLYFALTYYFLVGHCKVVHWHTPSLLLLLLLLPLDLSPCVNIELPLGPLMVTVTPRQPR